MAVSVYSSMKESENQIAVFLRELNLWWQYEFPVFVFDEKERPRVWSPAFFIPKLGIYIEVCGSKNFDYNYRKKIYKKNQINVIFVHFYKNQIKWKNYLVARIKEIEEKRHKDVMEKLAYA